MDMDGDKLLDLAVGAHGSAVLLRCSTLLAHGTDNFFPLVFPTPYVTDHSCVQVSQHSADQHEPVLSATLHQCHTEELP